MQCAMILISSGDVLIFADNVGDRPQSHTISLRCSMATGSSMTARYVWISFVIRVIDLCWELVSLSVLIHVSTSANFGPAGAVLLRILSRSFLAISMGSAWSGWSGRFVLVAPSACRIGLP